MRLGRSNFTIISGAFVALLAGVVAQAAVRMVGTDLLGIEATRALYEFAGRAEVPLALAFDGSRPALNQLKAGRADLALLVLTPDETPALEGFESIALAYHCVVVLAPSTVPLDQITLGQLRDVFGESGSNNLSRWGDLGVAGDLAAGAIGAHLPAVGQGIAVEFFRQTVLQDRSFKSSVMRYATTAELLPRLIGERRGLALAPVQPNVPGVKMVRVASRAREPAFSPTPENLHSGDYPLALPLRLVFRRGSGQTLRPLLGFMFSDEFARVLEQAQLVPLAPAARHRQLAVLEKP
jgi:phosphate transport system substrate-binding protein